MITVSCEDKCMGVLLDKSLGVTPGFRISNDSATIVQAPTLLFLVATMSTFCHHYLYLHSQLTTYTIAQACYIYISQSSQQIFPALTPTLGPIPYRRSATHAETRDIIPTKRP
ncbi:hypothetical protein NEOLEDRAFT_263653 [Neolentinus lepideus HHB14362 ss-1]|uniref:Uncharacterized protein n=1 Tax=Neolentinus lepideus HHB14362 ss-1 TaxID=1314782 RepID=A0A165T2D1_9AGAM|nr:hypothetical protein NEOLEDRAFT_263653 [Neolentinus lepideus HHB14362 ss-1]